MTLLKSLFSVSFIKFSMVGVSNTLIDFVLFTICFYVFNFGLVLSNITSFTAAVINSYVLNRNWTFAGDKKTPPTVRQVMLFLAGSLIGLLLNTSIVVLVSKLFPVLVAKASAIAVTPVWNFLFYRYIAFGIRH